MGHGLALLLQRQVVNPGDLSLTPCFHLRVLVLEGNLRGIAKVVKGIVHFIHVEVLFDESRMFKCPYSRRELHLTSQ